MAYNKKRIVTLVLFGVTAIAAAVFLLNSPGTDSVAPPVFVPVTPPAPATASVPANAVISATIPVLPKGAMIAGQVLRDIFLPPAEYAALLSVPVAVDRGAGGKAFSAGPLPALTGVIAGAGTRVVILRQGTVSRSYRIGDLAGAYRIAAIGASSVTLTGPAGPTVLTMGQ